VSLLLATSPVVTANSPQSWQETRYTYVVHQNVWWSCGAAAVATLLEQYYGVPVQEEDILDGIMRRESLRSQAGGLSMLSLQEALSSFGVNAKAFQISIRNLADYFNRGGLPIIVHFARPRPHFVVAVALINGILAVADPSFGERLLTLSELESTKGFAGYILVPLPNSAQFSSATKNQSDASLRFTKHHQRLNALRSDTH
jgi:predicted double-glycine peptidase